MQDLMTKINEEVYSEVLSGLSKPQKELPSKLFYDEKGSLLFDQICRLEEYYPTRTELMLMKSNVESIITTLGENIFFVEFGSGSSLKTRLLLSNLKNVSAYVPIDISEEHLLKTAESLRERYPGLRILPVAADYTKSITLPDEVAAKNNIIGYFPGSTIGNFTKTQAEDFIRKTRSLVGKNGGMLIGVDLQKDIAVLEAAYNDSKGVTAEFNLNILEHLNREFNFNFDIESFEHKAIYNREFGRIEMYLYSKIKQDVRSGDNSFHFEEGETILTEYSHKYTIKGFAEMVSGSYSIEKFWTDEKEYFAVLFLKAG